MERKEDFYVDMASRRETRSQLRENKDGGSGGFNEEMDKWRKVADMIGESLESVCNMGQQERDELVMLLPDDDGDAFADVVEKDTLLAELLESDDEGDIESLKRPRNTTPKIEEPMEKRKKSKISDENNSDKPKRFILLSRSKKKAKDEVTQKVYNASDQPSPVTVRNLDFSYVSPKAPDSKLITQSPSSESSSKRPTGLESPNVTGNLDYGILSPIFKRRIKKACRRNKESYDVENIEIHELHRNVPGKNIQLQLNSNGSMSEKFRESDYVVEQDEGTDVTTRVNDSPNHDVLNDNQNEKSEINDEKNARTSNMALETEIFNESPYTVEQNPTTDVAAAINGSSIYEMVNDNQSEKNEINYEKIGKASNEMNFINAQNTADDSECGAVPGNIVECDKKSIGEAVIDKIVHWNDFYNINLINQNVLAVEECIYTMEENSEKFKFKNAIKNVSIVKEVAQGVEDIQKYYTAIKKIKGEYAIQEEPPLVNVCSGRREDGFGLKATRMKPKSSRSSRVENKSGISGLAKAESYLNSRVRTRSKDKDENINIEVDDSFDDFDNKDKANNTAWHPDSQKRKRGRPSKMADEKSKLPSSGETKKSRGGIKRKLLSKAQLHQRFDDSPSEEESKSLPVSKQTKGKGLYGKTGKGKGAGKEEKNNNVGRKKMMNNENNNPVNVASTSTKSFGGESFSNQEGESSDADEIKSIGVIPSPASTSLSDGRKGSNYGLSNHEQIFISPLGFFSTGRQICRSQNSVGRFSVGH